jgi:hypothetical protein
MDQFETMALLRNTDINGFERFSHLVPGSVVNLSCWHTVVMQN